MTDAAIPMVELWRGDRCESRHLGHAVICDAGGAVVAAWGDPGRITYPRSACKMIQALPLVESGAARRAGLTAAQLALACASHQGAALHRGAVEEWLAALDLAPDALRCGAHEPFDRDERERLIRAGEKPCQCHNNCSGKHAGFLTLNRELKGGAEYVEADHPLQRAVLAAFEAVTGETSPGFGIDGCAAPNWACSLTGLARAMAFFAAPPPGARGEAARDLTTAMMAHPEMVAGEGRACTALMRAAPGRFAVKTGAEAVYTGIVPGQGLGIALKIEDGGTRAAEAVIAALLHHLGLLEAGDPVLAAYAHAPQRNWRGMETGQIRLAPGFLSAA